MTVYYSDLLKSETVTAFLTEIRNLESHSSEELITIMTDLTDAIIGSDLIKELEDRGTTLEDYVREHVVLPEE